MSIRKKLLCAIERDPKTPDELVADTLLSKTQVTTNMALIIKDNLATRENDAGIPLYYITDAGRDWIKLHQGEDDTANVERAPGAETGTKNTLDEIMLEIGRVPVLVKTEEPIKIAEKPMPAPNQTPENNPLDVQIGGGHYKDLAIQPVEYIHRNGIGFIEGSVIKYVTRWRAKGGVEDLKKARHFLDLLIQMEGIA